MEASGNLVKCRSSNTAKATKSDYRNKKCRSNAELPPFVKKKRGVYVERRITESDIDKSEKNQIQKNPKAPLRPRPGSKNFLASVLTILSKSSAGTQCPDPDVVKHKNFEKLRIIDERKLTHSKNINAKTENIDEGSETNVNDVEVKGKTELRRKYRSKVLNNDVHKQFNKEQVVVLQSQKDVIQTPSLYSENEFDNCSNLFLLDKDYQRHIEKEKANNVLVKEIIEGQKSKKKRVRIDEPNTLVADTTVTQTTNDDGKLYNLFVDLLETTMNDYDGHDEFDKVQHNAPSDGSQTKISLEIEESVARLPDVKIKDQKSPNNNFCCFNRNRFQNVTLSSPIDQQFGKRLKTPKNRKVKTESFLRKPKPLINLTENMKQSKNTTTNSRRQQKKNLLNLFKEQLSMEMGTFYEPQNMYEALKVIAQNKQRNEEATHFEEPSKTPDENEGFPDCMIKRHKSIMMPRSKTTNRNYLNSPSISGRQSKASKSFIDSGKDLTNHTSFQSLEVIGFNYETDQGTKDVQNDYATNHSSISTNPSLCSKDLEDLSDMSLYCF